MSAADLVLAFHFLYVACVVLPAFLIPVGAPLGWAWVRNRTLRLVQLSMMALVAAESAIGVICPLTWLESALRGAQAPAEGFLASWLHRLMFFDAPPWLFGALYAAFLGLLLLLWRIVPPRRVP